MGVAAGLVLVLGRVPAVGGAVSWVSEQVGAWGLSVSDAVAAQVAPLVGKAPAGVAAVIVATLFPGLVCLLLVAIGRAGARLRKVLAGAAIALAVTSLWSLGFPRSIPVLLLLVAAAALASTAVGAVLQVGSGALAAAIGALTVSGALSGSVPSADATSRLHAFAPALSTAAIELGLRGLAVAAVGAALLYALRD